MKASEVLKRYAKGDRNFRGANLRGQSFKGKDLSGADFSEADIRSADFTGANLTKATFTGAKCGLQKRWAIVLTILAWILAAISGFISIPVAANFFSRFDNFSNFNGLILNLVSLIVVITLSTIIIRQEIRMASAALAIGVVLTAAGIGVIPVGVATAIVGFIAGAISAAVPGAIGGFIALLSAVVGVVAGIAEVLEELGLETIAVAGVGAVFVKGVYDGWHEIEGQERDTWIHPFVVAFSAIGGTSFYGANLTGAIFTRAKLKSTNFKLANITCVFWYKAFMLNRAFSGDTYLQYVKVRQWLIGEGKDKNFDRQDLRGINLQGANLTDASFIGADLSEANLQDADLSRAKLVQTQLDKTDFTGATLTGSFIEDWGITAETILKSVQCDYIFTRLPPEKRPDWLTLSKAESLNPNPQRKPDDWNRDFEPGEFEDFITPLRQTLLDLYHNQPTDPSLAVLSFQDLQKKNPQAELELVSVARTGKNRDKLHLKAATSPKADRSTLHAEYFTNIEYLQSLSPEAQRALLIERGATINRFLTGGSSISINNNTNNNNTVAQTTQSHSGNGDNTIGNKNIINNSRTQNISNSTIHNSGAGAFSLGDISGTVANTINQLPNFANEPEKQELKELLNQLQNAVLETELDEEEKAESLEQIKLIASSLTNSQDGVVKKTVKTAMKLLRGTAAVLPKGSAMITICNQLPDLIEKILS